ncbi:MAG TPA: multicopper oxidase domain-containing protein [Anaeromyxobacter sp.]|nr:multicopper oxidase domain-containing protein [Anaeromyxobacter sp.]
MTRKQLRPSLLSRRSLLRGAGTALLGAAGVGLVPGRFSRLLLPEGFGTASAAEDPPHDLFFAGTDGWMWLPETPAVGHFHPDVLAPPPFTTYIFGFRNVTGLTPAQRAAQKLKAQHSAPIWWVPQYDGTNEFRVALTNLGLGIRPDLTDAHTVHWHGFRNVVPFFDGEPSGSFGVPAGRVFVYAFRPRHPGTYMYHCHVEDTEHVQMGMTGIVFVRPLQDGNTALYPSGKYAYNDGDGSTGFDREFVMFLSEVWAESHWCDAHIQLPEWSDYRVDFGLLNGRVWPDTIAPNGSIDPFHPVTDASGDLLPPGGIERLKYQPFSSLVTCNAGERVLLRFANLGFREASMATVGLRLRVVGKDATLLRGRDGTDGSYEAQHLSFGAGEAIDAIFTAPPHSGGSGPDVYVLHDRAYRRSDHAAGGNAGGRRTEIRVFPPGTLPPQGFPNT